MSRTRLVRGVVATIATSSLALVGVGLGAGSAAADIQSEIFTSSVAWSYIDDQTGSIGDARQYDYESDVTGWTDDAFDDFGYLTLTDPVSGGYWNFLADQPAMSTINDGGTSTLTMTGTSVWTYPADSPSPLAEGFVPPAQYTVVLTLTLEGNYARWSYAIDGPDVEGLELEFGGNLGSDTDSVFLTDDTTVVSSDGGTYTPGDPVLGYSAVTDGTFNGWFTNDLDDEVSARATGAANFAVTLVAADWTVCGFDEAQTFVESIVSTLPTTFGESYETFGSCFTFEPVALKQGVAVNQVLVYTVAPELIEFGYFVDGYVTAELPDLPAGLSYASETLEDGTVQITLTGTPTEGGSFTPTAVFYQIYPEDAEPGRDRLTPTVQAGQLPIYSAVSLFVEPLAVPTPVLPGAAAPAALAAPAVLAATGFDGGLAAGLGGLVALLGTALLVMNARHKRQA
ncbi:MULTISPECIES: hypothetical protein [Cryobacterium]|uniref:Gram-positive cocci surface proteins LPxTG domain-containing protein n=1 Tax=Cryobacterium breve TaxID=1259258 RepID=A0ABY2IW09_9MICO|nr:MULTISPECIES: hypothetical protein [Cryobacterium]TFC93117.1 hypothetical protein E3T20_10870 [Cryobacterium sp. TmT3-12]TFC96102.1 hypothetical protein E3O65_13740 [Cryobacterium breve]